jgi:hypothetical protein
MEDKIQLLSLDYDLKPISNKELAITMMEACAVYNECQHSIPASTEDAWIRVEYVAEEILLRANVVEDAYTIRDYITDIVKMRDAEAVGKEEVNSDG